MQQLHHCADRLLDAERVGVDNQLRFFRCLIGRINIGLVFDFTGARFFVQTFHIPRFAGFEACFAIDLNKIPMRHQLAHRFVINAEGLMKAVIAMTPASIINFAASPIRRMFSRRSSSEKPRLDDRPWRTLSPSNTKVRQPSWCSCSSTACASVDVPAPDNPVNQSTQDLWPFCASRRSRVTVARCHTMFGVGSVIYFFTPCSGCYLLWIAAVSTKPRNNRF